MSTATRDNWRTHPHSRWAFHHLDELLPVRPVPRGGRVRALESAPVDLSGLRFADGEGVVVDWPEFLEHTHSDALIVLHRGRIVVEHYANGMTPTSRHMLFSVTKSVVGLLAEMLAAEGKFDLARPAGTLVPELAGTAFGDATLRTLLDMRDGVPFNEDYADPGADIHRYSQAYWGDDAGGVRAALRRLPPAIAGTVASGAAFAYRTPIADVVGWAIERATGQGLAELLSDRLWRHIGAEHDAFFVLDNAGHAIAGAGLNATLRDMARLGQLLLDGGGSVVHPAALAGIAAGGDRAAFAAAAPPTRQGWSYRSFWWVAHDAVGSFAALGVFGQRLIVRPADELVIVRFGSHPVAANAPTDPIHAAAFDAVAERLRGSGGD